MHDKIFRSKLNRDSPIEEISKRSGFWFLHVDDDAVTQLSGNVVKMLLPA